MSSRGVQQQREPPPPPPPPGSSSPHHRSSPHQHQRQRHVIVEILSANLTRNFELPGCRMDPYAVVERVECDPISTPDRGVNAIGRKTSSNGSSASDQHSNHRHGADGAIMVARTDTHWDAHKHPVWEHTCRPFPYTPRRERLDVSVYEDNRATRAEWCGTASVPLDDVLPRPSEAKNVATSPGGSGDFGPVREIPLVWKKGQVTGTVSVRARLVMRKAGRTRGVHSPGKAPPQSSSSSASLTGGDGGSSDGITRVDPRAFVQPVERLGVSGGTAPFFRLHLVDPDKFKKTVTSATHYIGKDLSHAADEIAFYEEMLLLIEAARVSLLHRNHRSPSGGGRKGQNGNSGAGLADRLDAVALSTSLSDDDTKDENALAILLDSYAFEYAGVLVANEAGVRPPDDPTRQLLVLRNLRDGKSTLRLLDLKMGRQTASANWQGKTRGRALRQKLLDGLTNSTAEGYRLEGFDGRPDALASFDPMLDVPDGLSERNVHMYRKKAGRIMLQSMNGTEIFAHFLDLHRDGVAANGDDDDMVSFCYTTEELSELVLHEIVLRLVRLAVLCHKVSVPQKWVGSSVALGYDSGLAANPPPRAEASEREIRSSVLVNVFDWGRSELNTAEKMEDLTPEEVQNREKFWGYYTGGVDRLAWVAAKTYLHRFGNAESWRRVTFTVLDFDSVSKDDFLGQATVPVAATNGIAQCQLEEMRSSRSMFGGGAKVVGGGKCCNDDGGPTLYYSMEWRPLGVKVASRLEGTWRVTIHRAENLPNADSGTAGVSDPYCVVTAVSSKRDENGGVGRGGGGTALSFEQVTSVKPNTLSPTWNETLDLPVARRADALRVALEGGGMDLGKNVKRERDLRGLLPQESILPVDTPSLRQTARSVTSTSFDEWSDLLAASPMPDVGLHS